jgi:hypothetical protein
MSAFRPAPRLTVKCGSAGSKCSQVKQTWGTICADVDVEVNGVIYESYGYINGGKKYIKGYSTEKAIMGASNDMQPLYQAECSDHDIYLNYPGTPAEQISFEISLRIVGTQRCCTVGLSHVTPISMSCAGLEPQPYTAGCSELRPLVVFAAALVAVGHTIPPR